MRVFTHPNLLSTIGASITSDTSACSSGYTAENLIKHLDNRSCSHYFYPLTDVMTPTAEYNSCLQTDESLLSAAGHQFVLGFELGLSSFVHKLLYVEGHKNWTKDKSFDDDGDSKDKTKYHLQNVVWHVGDSPNYLENPQCPGGSQMNKDDATTYYFSQQVNEDVDNDIFDQGPGKVHKNGNEIECNLTGKYVTMVSDMSEEAGNGYIFSICSVGIFGSSYYRDEPLTDIIEVFEGGFPTTFAVPNVQPSPDPGDIIDINLRLTDSIQ